MYFSTDLITILFTLFVRKSSGVNFSSLLNNFNIFLFQIYICKFTDVIEKFQKNLVLK